MTRCILYLDSTGNYTGFSVRGHAGYAEAGSDIVCAAVSALTTTCVNAMESVAGVLPHGARMELWARRSPGILRRRSFMIARCSWVRCARDLRIW